MEDHDQEKKVHRACGGKVVWKEPSQKTHYSFAGKCLKCGEFPISEENILFPEEKKMRSPGPIDKFIKNKEAKKEL